MTARRCLPYGESEPRAAGAEQRGTAGLAKVGAAAENRADAGVAVADRATGTTVRVRYLQDVGADQRLGPSVVKLIRLGIVPGQLRLPV